MMLVSLAIDQSLGLGRGASFSPIVAPLCIALLRLCRDSASSAWSRLRAFLLPFTLADRVHRSHRRSKRSHGSAGVRGIELVEKLTLTLQLFGAGLLSTLAIFSKETSFAPAMLWVLISLLWTGSIPKIRRFVAPYWPRFDLARA